MTAFSGLFDQGGPHRAPKCKEQPLRSKHSKSPANIPIYEMAVGCAGSSRALEANLAAAAGQLRAGALPGDRASNRAGPAAGLGCRDGVQAVRQHIQHRLGSLRGPGDQSALLQQLWACINSPKWIQSLYSLLGGLQELALTIPKANEAAFLAFNTFTGCPSTRMRP